MCSNLANVEALVKKPCYFFFICLLKNNSLFIIDELQMHCIQTDALPVESNDNH